ncbi:MAG: DMP19 family protein [Bacteroidaceae bacterium]|nr:DMP19 family protein [Bacteroidaceae bacterium]
MSNTITLTDHQLKQAAEAGIDEFLKVIATRYLDEVGGQLSADTMDRLSGEQHTLLAYWIFREEIQEGGFIQLIQNGYGAYIFLNPFAKAIREWGLGELTKLIYAARKLYELHHEELEKEYTEEEFMALYEQFGDFDDLQDQFIIQEEEFTTLVASYVDEHLNQFITIEK